MYLFLQMKLTLKHECLIGAQSEFLLCTMGLKTAVLNPCTALHLSERQSSTESQQQ